MLTLELAFYLVIFIAAVFTFGVVMNFATSMQASRALAANRRARMLAEGISSAETLARLTRRGALSDADREGEGWLTARISGLEPILQRAGLKLSAMQFVIIATAVGACVALLFWLLLGMSLITAIFFAAVIAAVGGSVYVMSRVSSRQAKMTEQLPDVLDMIVRSLQAGHPIRAALGLVASDVEDPLGTEFGIAVDEMTFGLELETALDNLRQRVRVADLGYMIVAINIHSRTGGNLAEILSNLSGVIRDRYRVFKKVKALSAEGRLSASIIAVVPFVIAVILGLNVPNYYSDLVKHQSFPVIALAAISLYAVSLFAIWRIIKIRV
jgi:tight adherence protein B